MSSRVTSRACRDRSVAVLTGMHKTIIPGFAMALLGCTSAPDHKLPSATFTPHLSEHAASVACGEDLFWYADTTPDARYLFSYDNLGRLVHADGTFTAGGTDSLDYSYDGNSNMTHMLDVAGDYRTEIDAAYDATNGLTDYTYAYTNPDGADSWSYAYSNFLGPWQPQRETISEPGQPDFGYTLVYDAATQRLVQAVPDSGPTTTWTYDDTGLTITQDTSNGAWHGVVTYDADFRELSEVWGGTDPSAWASDTEYQWNGDQFAGLTYASGTEQDPHTPVLLETETMRYDCAMARTNAGRAIKVAKARGR
jgi:hypothetical protein